MLVGKSGWLAAALCFVVFAAGSAMAADVVFKNGQVLRDVKVITRSADSISLQIPGGVGRYPLSALQSIDGRPVEMLEPPAPVVPSTAAGQPAAPESATAGRPATAAPVVEESPAPDRWNFEFFLIGYLVIVALWMRGLRIVQSDLYERRVEPRYWVTAATVVPALGAGAYLATRFVQQKLREAEVAKSKKAAQNSGDDPAKPAESGTGLKFPSLKSSKKFDPADHIAKKGTTRKGLTFLDTERQSIAIKGEGEEASGLDNASEILEEALLENASDIHIEPASDVWRVRFRLDGIMHERMSFEPTDGVRLVSALKSLAEIDVSEKRKSQDGKFRVRCDEREVDFRVATANSIYGEKMVIRVLDHSGGVFDLTSLGMSADMLAQFQHVINSRNGMILATGPTGSGKTSTLYAALRQLDGTRLNIMTIEDPVEYELASATQIAVNPKAGVTYEGGLRSILRQDPDVILVGEMRDAEATTIALRAALTGHLVFSTLHTKDAIGTISRLQDLGIERYQVASALLMVLAQRLVRVLCPDCRKEYPATGHELDAVGLSFEAGATLYAAQGCDACHGTGFRGRTGLFEILVLDDEFRQAFSDGKDETTLGALAIERGFRNYRYDGAEKVLMGITTVEEVLRAT
jgi:type II secretory ATPase GspE/PulE/Tfp pilus assembly ATPase PilB-like protein